MEPDRIEELTVDECLELLASHHFGRVAIDDPGGPIVLPVNYVLDQGSVIFRTDVGTKLDAATERERVGFEVDELDEAAGTGWSVLVRGKASEITDPAELERVRELPIRSFAGGERHRYVRLLSAAITGRRIPLTPGATSGPANPPTGR